MVETLTMIDGRLWRAMAMMVPGECEPSKEQLAMFTWHVLVTAGKCDVAVVPLCTDDLSTPEFQRRVEKREERQ